MSTKKTESKEVIMKKTLEKGRKDKKKKGRGPTSNPCLDLYRAQVHLFTSDKDPLHIQIV